MTPAAGAVAEPLDERLDERVRTAPKDVIFFDGRPLSDVYGEYRQKLCSFFLKKTGSQADADDLVSQTFLRVLNSHRQYRSGTNLNAWLYRIAFTTFVNQYRRQRFEAAHFSPDDVPEIHALEQGDTPETLVARRQSIACAEAAIDRLPEDYRDTAWLTVLREFHYQETANALAIPLGTVMSRIYRARKRLMRKEGLYEALK